jgi:hypothetical protein
MAWGSDGSGRREFRCPDGTAIVTGCGLGGLADSTNASCGTGGLRQRQGLAAKPRAQSSYRAAGISAPRLQPPRGRGWRLAQENAAAGSQRTRPAPPRHVPAESGPSAARGRRNRAGGGQPIDGDGCRGGEPSTGGPAGSSAKRARKAPGPFGNLQVDHGMSVDSCLGAACPDAGIEERRRAVVGPASRRSTRRRPAAHRQPGGYAGAANGEPALGPAKPVTVPDSNRSSRTAARSCSTVRLGRSALKKLPT